MFLSRRYTTNEDDVSARDTIHIEPEYQWLHDVSLEGDDKRSPLLRWLQDAQDAEQDNDNAGGTSRRHGCNSHGLPRGHDGMQITVGVLDLHLAHTLPPSHKVCGHGTRVFHHPGCCSWRTKLPATRRQGCSCSMSTPRLSSTGEDLRPRLTRPASPHPLHRHPP